MAGTNDLIPPTPLKKEGIKGYFPRITSRRNPNLAKNKKPADPLAKLVSLCKRRGIVFQSSEIYGGVGSTYDYGPYGVEIKNNIARLWWNEMTQKHDNIAGLDSAVILHPKVWEASGHLDHFSDALIECKVSKRRYKEDDLIYELVPFYQDVFRKDKKSWDENIKAVFHLFVEEKKEWLKERERGGVRQPEFEHYDREEPYLAVERTIRRLINENISVLRSPASGTTGSLIPPRQFNLMLQSEFGSVADEANKVYFRPETCQGIFLDWKIVQDSARLKIPFGIAQMGKAFRNEITTGNFIFRTREFEQMEMQFFVKPGDTSEWMTYWRENRFNWYLSLGVDVVNIRWYQHPDDKLAHYAKEAWDIEYQFPFGWGELEGIHDRGDFDLKAHQEGSGKDMTYFDDQTRERYIPHIVETSAGLNRTMLMLLWDAYCEDEQAGEKRVLLKLDPKIAPVKAAILPLVKKDGLEDLGRSIADELRGKWKIFFDAQGSIGRRYRRMDEIGTPFAFTMDYQTIEDGTVTVRWRDTLKQERINKDQIDTFLYEKLGRM